MLLLINNKTSYIMIFGIDLSPTEYEKLRAGARAAGFKSVEAYVKHKLEPVEVFPKLPEEAEISLKKKGKS